MNQFRNWANLLIGPFWKLWFKLVKWLMSCNWVHKAWYTWYASMLVLYIFFNILFFILCLKVLLFSSLCFPLFLFCVKNLYLKLTAFNFYSIFFCLNLNNLGKKDSWTTLKQPFCSIWNETNEIYFENFV